MNRNEANEEAKKIHEQWLKDRNEIEKKAKEDGKWQYIGLDSNNHLFKKINEEAKEKLKALEAMIDED